MEFALGLLLGGLVGVIMTVVLQPPLERHWARITARASRMLPRPALKQTVTDLAADGFIQLMAWSPNRPLDRRLHRAIAGDGREEPCLSSQTIQQAREDAGRTIQGTAGSIVGYSVDHGEAGPESRAFVIQVESALYSDGVAFQNLLAEDSHWGVVKECVKALGPGSLKHLPPNTFFIDLTLTTAAGNTLAIRRSAGGVETAKGLWALGACETMAPLPSHPGATPEDLFELAERAAKEELGLDSHELGPIWVSWFGIGRRHGLFCVAHTTTRLAEEQVVSRIEGCYANFEADAFRWIPLTSPELPTLAKNATDDWLPLTRVAARDLTRLRDDLQRNPSRG